MRDEHRFAAAHMVRVYGPEEAVALARRNYFTIVGTAGCHFWADVMVAAREIASLTHLRTDQLILRALSSSQGERRHLLQELDRRGMHLSEEQKRIAGLASAWPRGREG